MKQRLHIVVLEGQAPTKHNIQNHPRAPHVYLGPGVQPPTDYFRSSVVRAPTARLQEVAISNLVRQAKVGNFDV